MLPKSYNLITFAGFCPLGRPEALPHPRTRTRTLALPHRLTTMTFSERTMEAHAWKILGEKKPPCGGLVETLGFMVHRLCLLKPYQVFA